MKITEKIYYVGVNDRNKSLFGIYIDPILCNIGIYKDMSQYKSVGWDPTTDNADAAGTKIDAPFLWQPPEF